MNIRLNAALLLCAVLCAVPAFGRDAAVNATGTLVDVMCAGDIKTQADAEKHSRECALMDSCVKSGYGIFIDGTFHKFDAEGNKQAEAIFRATKKADHITVS